MSIPALRRIGHWSGLSEMTLSYTYFASKNGQPAAANAATPSKPNR